MALVSAHNLSFSYAVADGSQTSPAYGPVSLSIEEESFCLLTGLTGCGKTTLLRSMKPELAPSGVFSGSLDVCGVRVIDKGTPTHAMDGAFSASNVGFVLQDPDAQIVCDTVWHEIAFGLENIGTPPEIMRRRVAEVAHFLGIAPWVDRATDQLSGGQKQLLNLASVLALRPQLVLLDEPTAQLDPNAKRTFIYTLARIKRELGLTVVMATHMPEDVVDFATQEICLSAIGDEASLDAVWRQDHAAQRPGGEEDALCEPHKNESHTHIPHPHTPLKRASHKRALQDAESVVSLRDVFVRHTPNDPWVLKGLDLEISAGSVHAIVGGNGSGKTTLLRTIVGDLKPHRGKVKNAYIQAQAFLPQDPKAVFVTDSVNDELCEWQERVGYSDEDVARVKQLFGLEGMDTRHPYDLSGGQRQNLAFAKMILCRPQLLVLDEPTKGLDAASCANIVRQLRMLAHNGVTVVLSTHDLDVAAVCADNATLLFDGQAVCTQEVPAFFQDNLIWRPHEHARLYGALL